MYVHWQIIKLNVHDMNMKCIRKQETFLAFLLIIRLWKNPVNVRDDIINLSE